MENEGSNTITAVTENFHGGPITEQQRQRQHRQSRHGSSEEERLRKKKERMQQMSPKIDDKPPEAFLRLDEATQEKVDRRLEFQDKLDEANLEFGERLAKVYLRQTLHRKYNDDDDVGSNNEDNVNDIANNNAASERRQSAFEKAVNRQRRLNP